MSAAAPAEEAGLSVPCITFKTGPSVQEENQVSVLQSVETAQNILRTKGIWLSDVPPRAWVCELKEDNAYFKMDKAFKERPTEFQTLSFTPSKECRGFVLYVAGEGKEKVTLRVPMLNSEGNVKPVKHTPKASQKVKVPIIPASEFEDFRIDSLFMTSGNFYIKQHDEVCQRVFLSQLAGFLIFVRYGDGTIMSENRAMKLPTIAEYRVDGLFGTSFGAATKVCNLRFVPVFPCSCVLIFQCVPCSQTLRTWCEHGAHSELRSSFGAIDAFPIENNPIALELWIERQTVMRGYSSDSLTPTNATSKAVAAFQVALAVENWKLNASPADCEVDEHIHLPLNECISEISVKKDFSYHDDTTPDGAKWESGRYCPEEQTIRWPVRLLRETCAEEDNFAEMMKEINAEEQDQRKAQQQKAKDEKAARDAQNKAAARNAQLRARQERGAAAAAARQSKDGKAPSKAPDPSDKKGGGDGEGKKRGRGDGRVFGGDDGKEKRARNTEHDRTSEKGWGNWMKRNLLSGDKNELKLEETNKEIKTILKLKDNEFSIGTNSRRVLHQVLEAYRNAEGAHKDDKLEERFGNWMAKHAPTPASPPKKVVAKPHSKRMEDEDEDEDEDEEEVVDEGEDEMVVEARVDGTRSLSRGQMECLEKSVKEVVKKSVEEKMSTLERAFQEVSVSINDLKNNPALSAGTAGTETATSEHGEALAKIQSTLEAIAANQRTIEQLTNRNRILESQVNALRNLIPFLVGNSKAALFNVATLLLPHVGKTFEVPEIEQLVKCMILVAPTDRKEVLDMVAGSNSSP